MWVGIGEGLSIFIHILFYVRFRNGTFPQFRSLQDHPLLNLTPTPSLTLTLVLVSSGSPLILNVVSNKCNLAPGVKR